MKKAGSLFLERGLDGLAVLLNLRARGGAVAPFSAIFKEDTVDIESHRFYSLVQEGPESGAFALSGRNKVVRIQFILGKE